MWTSLGATVLAFAGAACNLVSGVNDFEFVPGSGTGGGGAGGAPSEVIAEWIAVEPDPASGAYALPPWLRLESPSSDKTVQTGPHTVRTGFGPDAARARSVDGVRWGLCVEAARRNRISDARLSGAGWSMADMGMIEVAVGPDGTDGAGLVTDSDPALAARALGAFEAEPGAPTTVSAWVSSGGTQAVIDAQPLVDSPAAVIPPGTEWTRVSLTDEEDVMGSTVVRLFPANAAPEDTGSAIFDLVSVETGRYPSSVILSSGGSALRAPERLVVVSPAEMIPGGWFRARMTIAPHYASGEEASDHDLLFVDAQNRLFVSEDDSALVLLSQGQEVLRTGALAWARDEALEIEISIAPSGAELVVRGDSIGTFSVRGTAAAWPTGALILLGDILGSQEGADLRAVSFLVPR